MCRRTSGGDSRERVAPIRARAIFIRQALAVVLTLRVAREPFPRTARRRALGPIASSISRHARQNIPICVSSVLRRQEVPRTRLRHHRVPTGRHCPQKRQQSAYPRNLHPYGSMFLSCLLSIVASRCCCLSLSTLMSLWRLCLRCRLRDKIVNVRGTMKQGATRADMHLSEERGHKGGHAACSKERGHMRHSESLDGGYSFRP